MGIVENSVTRSNKAEVVELGDRMRHAARALVVGEVAVTLEEAIDDIEGCGDNEVVVVGKGNGVDEGGEERVEGVFIGETQHELGLGENLDDNDRDS